MPRFSIRSKITQKFLTFLLMVSILPMLIIGMIPYYIVQNTLRSQADAAMRNIVDSEKNYLDLQLRNAESLLANISAQEAIIEALDPQKTDDTIYDRLATQARIGYILDSFTNLDGLVSIDIFGMDGAHYHVGDTLDVSAVRVELISRIRKETLASDRQVLWLGVEDNVNIRSGFRKVITGASILTQTDTAGLRPRPVGLLLVNISLDSMQAHFLSVEKSRGSFFMVIDNHRRIIYHPDKSLAGSEVPPEFYERLAGRYGSFEDPGGGQLVTYARSDVSEWVLVSLAPLAQLMAGMAVIGKTNLVILAGLLLLIGIGAVSVQGTLVRPLREIAGRFRMFQEGRLDWKERLPYSSRHDEIGELAQWFNAFLDSHERAEQAQLALQESQERYSLALRGANDGIWDWDLRSGTMHFSARWKEMLGLNEDEINADPKEWFGRVHPNDLDRFMTDVTGHLEGRTAHFECEHRLLMKDGTAYGWFLARGMAVRSNGHAHRMAGSLTDITARKGIEERLTYDATHDPLTNLSNRVHFIVKLGQAIKQAKRFKNYHAAVLFLDLDRFKIINDSLGHVCGDRLLISVAERLSGCLRGGDTIARFGGDEFVVLLEDIEGTSQAYRIAGRLQDRLAEPIKLEGQEVVTTASIGIAMVTSDYNQPEEVLRDADTAMYRAKENGRARFELFNAFMHDNSVTLLRLEADLRRAVERQEFSLHYQPVVSLRTGEVTGVEALVRWNHPQRGKVPPGDFIPLAEDTGLILPMGEWILRTACKEIAQVHKAGFPDLRVSVNITARQVQTQKLPELAGQALAESGIGAHCLTLEITEHSAMKDMEQTAQALEALKSLGLSIAIDDFGTSYSALGYLKRFPVDVIKIDRSFIQDCVYNPDDAAITSALIAMGHILGLSIIAEGVETEEQAAYLAGQRCDSMQGFLYSPPVSLEALLKLLGEKNRRAIPLMGD